MNGQPANAVKFLRKVYPALPVVLTAIDPDGKGIETAAFAPGTDPAMHAFIEQWDGKRNLYWGVNPPIVAEGKKADRANIASMNLLHVDLDPRVGEDLTAERERIQQLLLTPPAGVLPPSIILYSGGGYQAFWVLSDPLPIGGDVSKADQAARYNLQLEVLLGGDATHDVSRIMRIPYTINVPGERKKKKGREAVMASVILFDDTRVYDLDQFTPAPDIQNPRGLAPSAEVAVSGNVGRLPSLDVLTGVSDYYKMVIVQGCDPTNADKYPSRSEAVFAVACELVRCGVSDENIYSVLTDPDFKISESVREKGSRADEYAKRQIRNAKDKAIDPMLAKFNQEHAVVRSDGGKCVIIREHYNPVLERYWLDRQLPAHFFNAYANRFVTAKDAKGKEVRRPAAEWWFKHESRREYDSIVFSPGRTIPDTYNLWRGFACEAKPGGKHEGFLRHLLVNLCSNNETHYNYLVGWMAQAVQKPGVPGQTAIVLRGDEGVGKSFFAFAFGALFGRHFLKVSQASHLVGHFNGHLQDTVVLFADEGLYAGDRQHANVLKDIITGKTLTVERKYSNAETTVNCLHVIMASNSQWVVPAGKDARRYFVLDVSANERDNHDYFETLDQDLTSGGYESLLYFLLNYDLAAYNVRAVPLTSALQEQKVLSLSTEESWWYSRLEEGRTVSVGQSWEPKVSTKAVYDDYAAFAREQRVFRPLTPKAFGIFLRRIVGDVALVQRTSGGRREWCYQMPGLIKCRAAWDSKFKGNTHWEIPGDDEDTDKRPDIPF